MLCLLGAALASRCWRACCEESQFGMYVCKSYCIVCVASTPGLDTVNVTLPNAGVVYLREVREDAVEFGQWWEADAVGCGAMSQSLFERVYYIAVQVGLILAVVAALFLLLLWVALAARVRKSGHALCDVRLK